MTGLVKMVGIGVGLLFVVDPFKRRCGPGRLRRSRVVGSAYGVVSTHSAASLSYSGREQIEKEVVDVIRALGSGGGFILSTIDRFFNFLWEMIQAMVDALMRMGAYPLK